MRGSRRSASAMASAIARSTSCTGSRGSSQKLTAIASRDGDLLGNHSGGSTGGWPTAEPSARTAARDKAARRGPTVAHLLGRGARGAGGAPWLPVRVPLTWGRSLTGLARPSLVAQPEDEESVAARRVHDVRREHGERVAGARPAADRHRHVLDAVDHVGDRESVGQVAEPDLPQLLARGVVERHEVAREVAREHEAAAGGERRRAAVSRAHAVLPKVGRSVQVHGLHYPEVAVGAWYGAAREGRPAAALVHLALAQRVGRGVGAELLHGQVEGVRERRVGGGCPGARTGVRRTVHRRLADVRYGFLV